MFLWPWKQKRWCQPVVKPIPIVKPLKRLVIDAGHGGRDPGAVDVIQSEEGDELYTEEKVIALSVAQSLNGMCHWDSRYESFMTRDEDVYVSLRDRVNFCNRKEADVVVSIHCDSCGNPAARGFVVWYHGNNRSSKRLAKLIRNEVFSEVNRTDFKIHRREVSVVSDYRIYPGAGFMMLREIG